MSKEPIGLYDGHAAINVKYYGPYPDDITEVAINTVQATWWLMATELAHERGYSGVFAEGRSGGWLIPYHQYQNGSHVRFWESNYPGQGQDYGYIRYPDVAHNGAERERFRAFQRRIQRLLKEVPEMLSDCMGEATTCAQ